jgi:hypothetical protein
MNLRERFLATMNYGKPDKIPNFEFGYLAETLPTWHEQGLPKEVTNEWQAYDYFGIEDLDQAWVKCSLHGEMREREVIEETEGIITFRDNIGAVLRQRTDGPVTIPHFLEFPLKTREDWKWFEERLQPDASRLPDDFDEKLKEIQASGRPVRVDTGSLMGWVRDWMGFEEYAIASLTDREWMEEIVETLTVMICDTLEKAIARGLKPDLGAGWEDICFNSGPICDLDFFNDIVVPRYKRISDILKKAGCDLHWTDCDGNITELVPGFMKGGINVMFPLEINGGADPVKLRAEHGKDLRLVGGVCKMRLAEGKGAIEQELKKLLPVVEEGGFIPHYDHRCQPTISFEDYKFYLDLKREMFNCGGEPKY